MLRWLKRYKLCLQDLGTNCLSFWIVKMTALCNWKSRQLLFVIEVRRLSVFPTLCFCMTRCWNTCSPFHHPLLPYINSSTNLPQIILSVLIKRAQTCQLDDAAERSWLLSELKRLYKLQLQVNKSLVLCPQDTSSSVKVWWHVNS